MPWLIGYPRDLVEWYPTVDADKCGKCSTGKHLNCCSTYPCQNHWQGNGDFNPKQNLLRCHSHATCSLQDSRV